jgi:hypothetical protein
MRRRGAARTPIIGLRYTVSLVSLIGIKPIIKCVNHQSCEHMELDHPCPGPGKNSLDKSHEFAYENTSFDYEFVPQPCDG